jgi:hypothetical protein
VHVEEQSQQVMEFLDEPAILGAANDADLAQASQGRGEQMIVGICPVKELRATRILIQARVKSLFCRLAQALVNGLCQFRCEENAERFDRLQGVDFDRIGLLMIQNQIGAFVRGMVTPLAGVMSVPVRKGFDGQESGASP